MAPRGHLPSLLLSRLVKINGGHMANWFSKRDSDEEVPETTPEQALADLKKWNEETYPQLKEELLHRLNERTMEQIKEQEQKGK